MHSHEIRVQVVDGTWETIGVDRGRGVVAEGISASSNDWGSDTFSCTLKRDVHAAWPDMTAFTPLEYSVNGMKVWSGFLVEAPVSDGAEHEITLQAKGWHYHLDDDPLRRSYVTNTMTEFMDVRSHPTAALGVWVGQPTLPSEGLLTIFYPRGTYPSCYAGVLVEQVGGPGIQACRLDWETSANAAGMLFVVAGCDIADYSASVAAQQSNFLAQAVSVTSGITVSTTLTARRFFLIMLVYPGGGTLNADVWIRVTNFQGYHGWWSSAGNSILYPDEVIKDVRDRNAPLLSKSNTKILYPPTHGSNFPIPDFGSRAAYLTPREYIQKATAMYDWTVKVDPEKRIEFRPRPTTASLELGASWSGSFFEDASANSGDDLYNKVIIEAVKSDGSVIDIVRTTADGVGSVFSAASQVTNPSFDTNVTGWTVNAGTLTRDTAKFDSTPASGRMTTSAGGTAEIECVLPNQIPGRTYTVTIRNEVSASTAIYRLLATVLNAAETRNLSTITLGNDIGAFATNSITYVAENTTQVLLVNAVGTISSDILWIDSVSVTTNRSSLLDKRGRVRTHVLSTSLALTEAAAQVVADTFLRIHSKSQLKGSLNVENNMAREVLTGRQVPAAEWLLLTGERVRLTDKRDPDTGDLGREGVIKHVHYSAERNSVSVTLDNERTNFEALLSRLGARLATVR